MLRKSSRIFRCTPYENACSKVREVNGMGMEVCCTLGMLNGEQAKQLKAAGLTAYNHNLDTSREFYPSVISTRRVVQYPAIVSCTRGIS